MGVILKYYDSLDGTWKPFVNNANDSVTLTGDQTISGVKTFTQPIVVPDASIPSQSLDFTTFPTFSAKLLSDQVISFSAFNKIVFNGIEWDNYAAFNTTTGEYVVPVSGIYHITGNWYNTSGEPIEMLISIWKNGALFKRGAWITTNGSYRAVPISSDIKLVAGDKISLQVYCNTGTGTVVASATGGTGEGTYFSGFMTSGN